MGIYVWLMFLLKQLSIGELLLIVELFCAIIELRFILFRERAVISHFLCE